MTSFHGRQVREWSRRCKEGPHLVSGGCNEFEIVLMPPFKVVSVRSKSSLSHSSQYSELEMMVSVGMEK